MRTRLVCPYCSKPMTRTPFTLTVAVAPVDLYVCEQPNEAIPARRCGSSYVLPVEVPKPWTP